MARQLSQIRDDIRQIIGQADASNSNFTNAQLNVWINEAYRDIVHQLEVATITSNTYTTANSVTLDGDTLTVDTVKIKNSSGEWKVLRVIDISDLARIDEDWENADAGEPDYAVRFGQFTMQMHPPLGSDWLSITDGLKTLGLSLPTALSSDTDTTSFAHHLDDIISHYVAYRCFSRLNNQERSIIEQRDYQRRLKMARKNATRWSRGRNRWQWHVSDGLRGRNLRVD